MNNREEQLKAFGELLDIMDELREKCPWDKKQTMETLRHLTIEETHELSDCSESKIAVMNVSFTLQSYNNSLYEAMPILLVDLLLLWKFRGLFFRLVFLFAEIGRKIHTRHVEEIVHRGDRLIQP